MITLIKDKSDPLENSYNNSDRLIKYFSELLMFIQLMNMDSLQHLLPNNQSPTPTFNDIEIYIKDQSIMNLWVLVLGTTWINQNR